MAIASMLSVPLGSAGGSPGGCSMCVGCWGRDVLHELPACRSMQMSVHQHLHQLAGERAGSWRAAFLFAFPIDTKHTSSRNCTNTNILPLKSSCNGFASGFVVRRHN